MEQKNVSNISVIISVLMSLSLYFIICINSGPGFKSPILPVLGSFQCGVKCGLSALFDSVFACLSRDSGITQLSAQRTMGLTGRRSSMSFLCTRCPRGPVALACSELTRYGWKVPGDMATPSTFSAGSCLPGPGPPPLLWTQPSFTPGQHVGWFPSHPLEARTADRAEDSRYGRAKFVTRRVR